MNGRPAATGLDVLCRETMEVGNPLSEITDSKKLFITPHMAWTSVESRARLMRALLGQIRELF